MLEISVPEVEVYDSDANEFHVLKGGTFRFEHCLRAVASWEEKWGVAFLDPNQHKTEEQFVDYYVQMCLDDGFCSELINSEVIDKLSSYMGRSHSATKIRNLGPSSKQSSYVTSEVIYANMAQAGIPFTCDTWYLDRLVNTLRIIAEQNSPKKKMGREDIARQNAELNRQRRNELQTKG